MKRLTFIPEWRYGREPIELVTEPTAEWFERQREHGIRFTLMPDGEIYLGSAFTITHGDITRFRIEIAQPSRHRLLDGRKVEEGPILVGVILWGPNVQRWRVCFLQWFMTSASEEPVHGRRFLQHVTTWLAIERTAGPFDWRREEQL